jgi:hypothetical protein
LFGKNLVFYFLWGPWGSLKTEIFKVSFWQGYLGTLELVPKPGWFCHKLKVAVPKTEVLEQPHWFSNKIA